ncbi:hypothetical protein KDJ56_10345 [Brevibacillus composti]|uniref:Uncharacterized protein n=1 Tax=Brevibacillus composti TaxID=2796470 RepID=A0A7T5EP95_9BACL|nr:hypothetical protein [Brevibacillus composti]QQE76278.1 hypothetical protein JD108_10655 [Brevibacillus composti]QUO43306.1 hypothetical protein KDJ56_10345 [Brevibacillus composti]
MYETHYLEEKDHAEYWEVHTEADEEHSDVYDYISDMSESELKEAEHHQVRYTIHVLNEMLASWF